MESVNLSPEVFKRVQALAVPLVDNVDSVLTRLLDHWDRTVTGHATTITLPEPVKRTHVKMARGTMLPIGLEMRADYLGHKFTAKVTERGFEANGKVYDGPSPAAVDAKVKAGASKTAAATNGWTFWMMDAPGAPGRICAIDYFRKPGNS